MTINKERVELFVAALESGKYQQCRGNLRVKGYNPQTVEYVDYYCALGVATAVALDNGLRGELIGSGEEVWEGGVLSPEVANWYGWTWSATNHPDEDPFVGFDHNGVEDTISGLNDSGVPFWDIAQAARTKWLKDEG